MTAPNSHLLKVVTYNMANYDDFGNWPARRQQFVDLITKEQPDVILFQVPLLPSP